MADSGRDGAGHPGVGSEVLTLPCEVLARQPDHLPGALSFTYRHASDRNLRLHVFSPGKGAAPHPAIVFFFGGGWRIGDITAFAAHAHAFSALGYVSVLVDYRVRCRDGTNPRDSLHDACAAYAWLRERTTQLGIDPERIVLCGGSAGGHLALTTAILARAGEHPAALVLFDPAVDLVRPAPFYLKPIARRISPSTLPVEQLPPTLIMHGDDDRIVPIGTVREFRARALDAGRSCRLDEYAGYDHSFYRSRIYEAGLGTSPYEHTLARAVGFLAGLGMHR